jgi:hypothetical protein
LQQILLHFRVKKFRLLFLPELYLSVRRCLNICNVLNFSINICSFSQNWLKHEERERERNYRNTYKHKVLLILILTHEVSTSFFNFAVL